MRNLKFLALLGLLGLLGLFTDNPGFYGFFGFFAFASFSGMKEDELLQKNACRAGFNAFLVSLVGLALAIALGALTLDLPLMSLAVGIVFAAQLVTFVVSFQIYERRGDS